MKSERTFVLSNNNEIEDLLANYRKIDQYLGFTRQISEKCSVFRKIPQWKPKYRKYFFTLNFQSPDTPLILHGGFPISLDALLVLRSLDQMLEKVH